MVLTPEIALSSSAGWLAQLAQPGINTPEEAALIFSGPQFFIALLSGLVLAFGFQMLLTNLSVAAGVSYLSHHSGNGSSGPGTKKISVGFGIWTLVTVSLALFFACWLSVKLSLYNSVLLGAITGLVIWGTYFTLLVWVSSTTVGSLIGSVVKSATSSFQTIVGTAAAALGAKATSNQTIATAEAAAAAVRKELTAGFDGEAIKENLQDYLVTLRSPEVNAESLEQEFERLIRQSNISSLGDKEHLANIDRQVFVRLVNERTDLSRREVDRIADRLYRTWQRNLGESQGGMSDLVNYLQSAKPEEILSEGIGNRLDQLLDELRKRRQQENGPNVISQGFNLLTGVVMGRTDISDFDIDKILDQIQSAKDRVMDQADQITSQVGGKPTTPNIVKADVENYLLSTYAWQLKPERLEAEFRNVLYDLDADPTTLRQQLEELNRPYFKEVLSRRGLMTQAEIQRLSLQLSIIHQEVLRDVTAVEQIQAEKQLRRQVEIFLQLTPKEELFSDMGDDAFTALVEDETADQLRERFKIIHRDFMIQFLLARADIQNNEAQVLANKYQAILERVAADHEGLRSSAQVRVGQQWQQLQDYLRNTDKTELNPEGIKRDLKLLLDEPEAGVRRVRYRVSQFDRDTLVQLLSQRPDISEAEANHILDEVETNWYTLIQAPARLSTRVQHQLDEASSAIATYLRNTGKEELNPDGIQRDLQQLLEHPKAGAQAIRSRLARMDRDTLVQLLSQREDLSEAEVNQTIDDLQAGIQSVLRAPRRLARRTQAQIESFQSALADYLRSTDKAALNPEGIQRDFKLLVEDPRLGMERLSDRLAQVDRSTLIALLSQRNDISEAEAAQIVDNVLSVRDQMMAQIRSLQTKLEAALDSIFARLRRYLNGLERPELNYEGIQRDLRTLFDDPQAGFDALRHRLSEFDRDTLIALLSSQDNISQADAERVVGQIESARDSVLRRAERLEHQVQSRLNDLKLQAQKQFEETRAAAEAAAWWLFGTALISAIVSAVGGGLAVIG